MRILQTDVPCVPGILTQCNADRQFCCLAGSPDLSTISLMTLGIAEQEERKS